MKRVGPKRVSVFEAGAGDVPFGVLGQALRAQKKRGGRTFVASDLVLREEEVLRQRGLKTSPANLRMVKECSIKSLQAMTTESKDIIFGSYFANLVLFNHYHQVGVEAALKELKRFFNEAKRVLKKNGRLILVQDLADAKWIAEQAQPEFKYHLIQLTDKQTAESTAEAINRRSTSEKRMQYLMSELAKGRVTHEHLQEDLIRMKLKNIDELAKPVVIILRKV